MVDSNLDENLSDAMVDNREFLCRFEDIFF